MSLSYEVETQALGGQVTGWVTQAGSGELATRLGCCGSASAPRQCMLVTCWLSFKDIENWSFMLGINVTTEILNTSQ